jgi:hypothetical protein
MGERLFQYGHTQLPVFLKFFIYFRVLLYKVKSYAAAALLFSWSAALLT